MPSTAIVGYPAADVDAARSLGRTLQRWRPEILAHHTVAKATNLPPPDNHELMGRCPIPDGRIKTAASMGGCG